MPHPLRRDGDDPPPPKREQLPLPRRQVQAHLEPQLRDPCNPGDGTPFAPFTDNDREPGGIPPRRSAGGRAAAFHEGTERARPPRKRPTR